MVLHRPFFVIYHSKVVIIAKKLPVHLAEFSSIQPLTDLAQTSCSIDLTELRNLPALSDHLIKLFSGQCSLYGASRSYKTFSCYSLEVMGTPTPGSSPSLTSVVKCCQLNSRSMSRSKALVKKTIQQDGTALRNELAYPLHVLTRAGQAQ